jgi:hypothetical protein
MFEFDIELSSTGTIKIIRELFVRLACFLI